MKPTLEQLESRISPSVDLVYGGGPLLQNVQVADLHADASMQAYTDQAMQVVLSQYLPLLTPYYGVGAGTLDATLNVNPLPGLNVTMAQIQQAITAEIQAGAVPQPNSSQLYVYFLAPNQVVTDAGGANIGGYHSTFQLNGQTVYYAVIYDSTSSQLSQIEAHETAEAVTDPQPYSGWDDPVLGGVGEVADILMWQPLFQFTLDGFLFSAPVTPNGTPIIPGVSPQQQQQQQQQQMQQFVQVQQQTASVSVFTELAQLETIAFEQFEALAYRFLALIDPRDFIARAAAAQQQFDQNLMIATTQAQQAMALGGAAFAQALSQ